MSVEWTSYEPRNFLYKGEQGPRFCYRPPAVFVFRKLERLSLFQGSSGKTEGGTYVYFSVLYGIVVRLTAR